MILLIFPISYNYSTPRLRKILLSFDGVMFIVFCTLILTSCLNQVVSSILSKLITKGCYSPVTKVSGHFRILVLNSLWEGFVCTFQKQFS